MPGRSDPVVLLHGCGGAPGACFEATGLITALEGAGRSPVALDLPGHGPGPQSHDPADYADLAGALSPRLPEGRFDAVGYSLGGKLLLELACRWPGRIGRMVLGGVGDNVFAPESVAEAAAMALEQGPTESTPAPVLAFLRTFDPHRNDGRAIAAVLRRPANPVFSQERLGALGCEVLIVAGEADPAAANARLVAALPGAEVRMLPGVDHFGLPARPEFVAAATAFLGAP